MDNLPRLATALKTQCSQLNMNIAGQTHTEQRNLPVSSPLYTAIHPLFRVCSCANNETQKSCY